MKSKEIYQSIDQSKLKKVQGGEKAIANLKRVEKETKGFTVENPKFDVAMGRLYDVLKDKNPEVLKNVKVEEKVKEVKVPTTKTEQKKDPKKKTKTVKKKVKKATGKKKVTKPTKTPSTPKEKKVPFSTRAKQLADKEGITFKEARVKLSKQLKEEKTKIEKSVKSDLDKLLAFVKSDKFEDGERYPKTYGQQTSTTSNVSADAQRKAKPVGRRVSEKEGETTNQYGTFKNKKGRVYYESRDNRSDRNSLKAPQGQYKYKGKTPPYLEAGGTLPTPFGQAGLVGETGTMNEVDLFAMGGDLPQGVHQYYANTYNPAYPTPHGYAKGGEVEGGAFDLSLREKSAMYKYLDKGDFTEEKFMKMFDKNEPQTADIIYYWAESRGLNTPQSRRLHKSSMKQMGYAKGGQVDLEKLSDETYRMGEIDKKHSKRLFEISDDLADLDLGNKTYAKGGKTDDVIMIKIGGDKKYPYYIKKIDTTHISMANNKDGVDLVTPSHILQHRGESYYDDVRSWLKGGKSPNGKSYDSDYYAKGGALSKEFKFDKNFIIYVPSTSNVGKPISKEELDKRVDEVEKFVANKFGGYTETETDGGYKSNSGKIIEEDIVKVSVFAKAMDWLKNENSVISKVRSWAKKWGQEAIGFEYEGDLYYVSENKIMKNGGVIDAFNLQFIKDVPKTNLKVEQIDNKISYAKGGRTKSATNRDRKYFNSSESWEKSVDSKGRKRPTYKKRKSTKSQGFNDRLDESLGETRGAKKTKKQSYKSRRKESEGMEKSMGRRKYSRVKTMDKGNREKRMPKKVKVFKSPQLSTKTKEMMISEDGRKVFIFENGMLYRTDNMGNKTQGQKMKETQYEVLSSESFADGGKIGFDALSKKVAKRYYNKAVPKKFQKQYGKTYSKAEAMEVGKKVAGKVYRQQQLKK
jgi:hypothetical protein